MWSLETIIALNKRRQAEYDASHPKEAEERRRQDAEEPRDSGQVPTPIHVPHQNGTEPQEALSVGVNGSKPPIVPYTNLRDTLLRLRY